MTPTYPELFKKSLVYLTKSEYRASPDPTTELLYQELEFSLVTAIDKVEEYIGQPVISRSFSIGIVPHLKEAVIPLTVPYTLQNVQMFDPEDGTWSNLETTKDYTILPSAITKILFKEAIKEECKEHYRVNVTAGFSESTIPPLLRLAIIQNAGIIFQESAQGGYRLGRSNQSVNLGSGTVNDFYQDWEPRLKELLKPYRIIPV